MIKRLLHWATKGKWYPHTLAGGWCPVCGAIHTYPGWLNPSLADWRRCAPRSVKVVSRQPTAAEIAIHQIQNPSQGIEHVRPTYLRRIRASKPKN